MELRTPNQGCSHSTLKESYAVSRDVYLSLGDSVTCGIGATLSENAFPRLVATKLNARNECDKTEVIAGHYWTTENLLRAVRAIPHDTWSETQVLSLLIGGNDLYRRYYTTMTSRVSLYAVLRAIDKCSRTLSAVLESIQQEGVPYIVVCTMYNPLPHSKYAVAAISRWNDHVRTITAHHRCRLADVAVTFAGHESEYIANYRTGQLQDLVNPNVRPVHPNDAGHQAIADTILSVLPPSTF